MNILLFGFILACGEKAEAPNPGALPESGDIIATVNGTNIHQNTVDVEGSLIDHDETFYVIGKGMFHDVFSVGVFFVGFSISALIHKQ